MLSHAWDPTLRVLLHRLLHVRHLQSDGIRHNKAQWVANFTVFDWIKIICSMWMNNLHQGTTTVCCSKKRFTQIDILKFVWWIWNKGVFKTGTDTIKWMSKCFIWCQNWNKWKSISSIRKRSSFCQSSL